MDKQKGKGKKIKAHNCKTEETNHQIVSQKKGIKQL